MVGISCEGHGDQTVALLTVIEEGHLWEEKGACSKSRGKRELLNLECSINYETTGMGKARLTFFSVKRFVGFGF